MEKEAQETLWASLQGIENFFSDADAKQTKLRTEFDDTVINGGLGYAIAEMAERVWEWEETYRMISTLKLVKQDLQKSEDWLPKFRNALEMTKTEITKEVLEKPYWHNSTSAVINLRHAVTVKARADFVGPRWATSTLRYLIEMVDEAIIARKLE